MSAVTAPETLPNLLRATASLIRVVHEPGCCPDAAVWLHASRLVDRVAAAEESGARLRVGERDRALQIARMFLITNERAEVPA